MGPWKVWEHRYYFGYVFNSLGSCFLSCIFTSPHFQGLNMIYPNWKCQILTIGMPFWGQSFNFLCLIILLLCFLLLYIVGNCVARSLIWKNILINFVFWCLILMCCAILYKHQYMVLIYIYIWLFSPLITIKLDHVWYILWFLFNAEPSIHGDLLDMAIRKSQRIWFLDIYFISRLNVFPKE